MAGGARAPPIAAVLAGSLVRIVPKLERSAGSLYIVPHSSKHVPGKIAAFRELVLELLRSRVGIAQAA